MKKLFLVFCFCFLFNHLNSTIINIPAEQTTIQAGINAAVNSDTVLVQPGTYVENINYNGKNITVGSLFLTTQDTSYISSTIIDGNAAGRVVTITNGESSSAVLTGFTITNGNISSQNGAGILCIGSSPTVEYVRIIANTTTSRGGGVYCQNVSSPTFQNVEVTNNTSGQGGGGMYFRTYACATLKDVIVSGNHDNSIGGGIGCDNANCDLRNVTVINNTSSLGGGIYCWDCNPVFNNITVTNNTANFGGGIACRFTANPNILNSILWNNSPEEIYLDTNSSITITYSDIEGGYTGTGNIDSDPLFADAANDDYHLTWDNFPVPDATMSPCINTGDPASPFDPDATITDMGAYYFDRSAAAPVITGVTDVPDDQGRNVQLIWNRSPYDAPNSPVTIESYSVWRYDDEFSEKGSTDIFYNPQEIIERSIKDNSKQYYWKRDDEVLTFISQIPATGYAEYSVFAPTCKDSSYVSTNYSTFQILAHTDVTLIYHPSLPDSGYSVDNIAPDETELYITQTGTIMNISWDEVEYGTYQGNLYPELNGIWYKLYAGDSPDFVCDDVHLIDVVDDLNYNYPLSGQNKKFFKVVVSDQPQ
ncbi:MAG: hypothetical protein JW794_03735 [Candidatus Cloacimonetes bacterium]|nr:hypothetical protein [Candidatus Cloacimonadota bacterium]